MHALLINPWIHDFAAYDLWSKPLGLLKIAAYLKHLGFRVSLVDCLDRFHPHYLNSGLSLAADPLLHNNSAFPLYRPDDYQKFQVLKDRVQGLNLKHYR